MEIEFKRDGTYENVLETIITDREFMNTSNCEVENPISHPWSLFTPGGAILSRHLRHGEHHYNWNLMEYMRIHNWSPNVFSVV